VGGDGRGARGKSTGAGEPRTAVAAGCAVRDDGETTEPDSVRASARAGGRVGLVGTRCDATGRGAVGFWLTPVCGAGSGSPWSRALTVAGSGAAVGRGAALSPDRMSSADGGTILATPPAEAGAESTSERSSCGREARYRVARAMTIAPRIVSQSSFMGCRQVNRYHGKKRAGCPQAASSGHCDRANTY